MSDADVEAVASMLRANFYVGIETSVAIARAAIAAYEARRCWQDINTAPKDGADVLITGYIYGDPAHGRWQQVAGWNGEEWATEQAPLYPPTHWRPLPPLSEPSP